MNGDVRLPGGDSGLVEVYYNGWGFICDDEWDTVDSNTLCQILGYSTAITSTTGSFHNSRNYKINFINCDGGESSILDCGYRVYRQNYCSQNEHVNVTCGPGEFRIIKFDDLSEIFFVPVVHTYGIWKLQKLSIFTIFRYISTTINWQY